MEHFPYIKVYRPTADSKVKWKSNMTSSLLHGSSQLKPANILIITKSMKDVMVLHEMGYQAVSPMAENVIPSNEIMVDLISAYPKIYIFYDNDGEFNPPKGISGKGKQAASKIATKYSLPMIFLPDGGPKDISDYVKEFGISEGEKTMK